MKYLVVLSTPAEKDLEDLLTYLEKTAGERTARQYVDQIIEYCSGSGIFPERGQSHYHIQSGLRTVGYRRRATIAFEVRDDTVTILRVFHRGQDVRFFQVNGQDDLDDTAE